MLFIRIYDAKSQTANILAGMVEKCSPSSSSVTEVHNSAPKNKFHRGRISYTRHLYPA